jgi:hypothetical protein
MQDISDTKGEKQTKSSHEHIRQKTPDIAMRFLNNKKIQARL